ncbi:hypothetical protein GCM10010521_48230 [Streptomyces rameus]|uniref:Uncharacterized protein n=1 Tax=Streptomyces rameus TaxID=68261 RepID=A0ABP6NP51_9ACTN
MALVPGERGGVGTFVTPITHEMLDARNAACRAGHQARPPCHQLRLEHNPAVGVAVRGLGLRLLQQEFGGQRAR